MGDVLIALLPIVCVSAVFYGVRALLLYAISVLSCVAFEYLYRRFFSRSNTLWDLSAVVTGIILACCLPATVPLWFPVIGSFFAVIVVKQLFGGLGKNIFNPALAGVVFLTVTWPKIMSVFPAPFSTLPALRTPQNFRVAQTALSQLKEQVLPDSRIYELLLGDGAGGIGVCAVLVLVFAALYLLYRRIINWQVPVSFIGTVAVLALLFPRSPSGRLDSALLEVMSGSVLFVAVFMAGDPVTSPVTRLGRLMYGILCGLLTVFIRYNGQFPEGAYFALLLANPLTMAFDRAAWRLEKRRRVPDEAA